MTLTPEQVGERRNGLFGGDAFCYATGRDQRMSQYQLWQRKIDFADAQAAPEPVKRASLTPHQNASRIEWGSRLEPVLREWLQEELGRAIHVPQQTYWLDLQDGTEPFMGGHLDGLTDPPMELVELKTADKFAAEEFGDPGTDQIPPRYVFQCHHYMLVTGLKLCHIGALVGGNDARHYVLPFDAELGDMMLERARAFWQLVIARTPPEPSTLEDAALRWPRSAARAVRADATTSRQLTELKQLRKTEKDAAERADRLEVLVKAYMGDCDLLTDGQGRGLATWRSETQHRFDTRRFVAEQPTVADAYRKAIEFRPFRLK